MKIMLYTFIISFSLFYSYYRIFVIRRKMEFNPEKVRPSINLLIRIYKLDFKKINYKKVVVTTSLVNSLLMAIVLALSGIVDKLWLQTLVMALLLIPSIYFSYMAIGKYYNNQIKNKKVK